MHQNSDNKVKLPVNIHPIMVILKQLFAKNQLSSKKSVLSGSSYPN